VPSRASVWYYFREMDYPDIKRNFEIGINMAKGAALMTDTEMSYRILGAAWPRHFNKVIAETMYEHIKTVGLPEWTEGDQALAKAVQRIMEGEEEGLSTEIDSLGPPPEQRRSGGSDDIGDVSWTVPTVTLRFPANAPGLPGHHWSSAITMATPIAHKGATAGAKVMAMTTLELFLKPELVEAAWKYFREEQTKDVTYTPLISADDKPAIDLNEEIMARYRAELSQYYYDETKYDTYLEQLGVKYPTLEPPPEK